MADNILNFDPRGPGGILIGNPNIGSGGFTSLSLSITNGSNGKAFIQGISASGSNFGQLDLNPFGGIVAIPTVSTAPQGVKTVALVVDPVSGRIYKAS
jgi:hypothetical protein